MKRQFSFWRVLFLLLYLVISGLGVIQAQTTTFAVVTDYGYANNTTVANVANMVNGWDPEFVVTSGDNSQGNTCDGDCYASVVGAYYGQGAVASGRTDYVTSGNFWPVPGNHDYYAPISSYQAYFNYLPPAEASSGATALYYDFVRGPVHFFMLNSGQNDNADMPDQTLQQTFLQNGLASSTAAWNIVVFHRPPYTSGTYHASDPHLQWPFEEWGADLVITGHNHIYERIYKDEGELRYITAGASGNDTRTGSTSFAGLEAYYFGSESGALKVEATTTTLTFQYITINSSATTETVQDSYTLTSGSSEDPTVLTSLSSLSGFTSEPGVPSLQKSYSVSGVNLTGDVTITPPAGFEISTTSETGFTAAPVILTPVEGTLPATTLYVRLNHQEEGTLSGNITHTSTGALTKSVQVSGAVTQQTTPTSWTAYNDMSGSGSSANTTSFGLDSSEGMLINYDDGSETGVTVTVSSQGSPYDYTDGGSMPDEGTDAYEIFTGKVNLQGVIMSATSDPTDYWVDVTFSNLDPAATYTFVATANRDGTGSGDPAYTERFTRYTISGMDAATNASSSGVAVYDPEGYSVYFCTGYNTENGYVAQWRNIRCGDDGSFTVRAQPQDPESPRTYAFGAFMLAADEPDIPSLRITGTLNPFRTPPGTASSAQTYAVSGSNLVGDVVITAPSGFEISLNGAAYSGQLTLAASGGTAAGTVYVRLTGTTEGTYNGNITHTSQGASARNLAVSGTVAMTASWVAYNDLVLMSGQPSNQITSYSIPGDDRVSSGLLMDYNTGENTDITVAVTVDGSPQYQDYDGEYSGSEAASGTDAYETFHGIANSTGLIQYGSSSGWWVDLEFTGLDPLKTYAFATTANRNDDSYTTRLTIFTISGVDDAVNASTSGVTENSNMSVQFCTGYNTVDGYVARWTGIQAGADGSFKVRAEEGGPDNKAYAFSVFMLQEEAGSHSTIQTSGTLVPFASQPGMPSASQSYSVSGVHLSEAVVLTAPGGFELSSNGATYAETLSLVPTDGTLQPVTVYVRLNAPTSGSWQGNISHTSSGAGVVNVAVSGTVNTLTGDALGDVNGDGLANSTDGLIILSCDAGINVSSFCPMNAGDVNGDGMVNSTDALIILSFDAGLSVPFPVGQTGDLPVSVTPCPGCNP